MLNSTILKHEEGLHGAVYARGNSFINAAILILENSHNELVPADNNIKKLSLHLKKIQDYWKSLKDDETLNLDTLAQLEKNLIKEIRETLYKNTDPRPSFKKVKDELDNAENHVNWKERTPLITPTGMEASVTSLRKEIPITEFTREQTEEWLDILSEQEENWPSWFKSLAKWEQNYFRNRLKEWDAKSPKPNLGNFLGPVPTTIRRYPGAPNAYITSVTTDGIHGNNTFTKIRSGVLVPTKMSAKNEREEDEKVRITKQNLEQLIIVAIKQKKEELSKQGVISIAQKEEKLPILLQTLYSPPFQPPGTYNNTAMMRAIEEVREELNSKDNFRLFLIKHNIAPKDIPFSAIDLLYANRPVNNARGLTWFTNLFSEQGSESRRTDSVLNSLAQKKLSQTDDPILRAALESYNSMPYLWNTVLAGKPTRNNPMAERAALEQIIAGRLGIRIGSCVSGKDREEMVTQLAIAQQEFFAAHGKFPDQEGRKEFVENVARAYLTGHGQALAGENSKGCDGLKNIVDVLGKEICEKIIALAPEYGIDVEKFNPIKTSQKVAGLNKLTLSRLLDVKIETFKEKWRDHANKKAFERNWGANAKGLFQIYISALRIYNDESHKKEKQRFQDNRASFMKKIGGEKNFKQFKKELKIVAPEIYEEYLKEVKRFNKINQTKKPLTFSPTHQNRNAPSSSPPSSHFTPSSRP